MTQRSCPIFLPRRARQIFAVFILGLLGALCQSTIGQEQGSAVVDLHPEGVAWTTLLFSAEALGVQVDSKISIRSTIDEASALVRNATGGSTAGRYLLAVDSLHSGRHSRVEVIFDPLTASVSSSGAGRLGENGEWKTYGFSIDGLSVEQRSPRTPQEATEGPEHWTKISKLHLSMEGDQGPCMGVSEASMLFYILTTAPPIEPPRYFQICMVSGTRLFVVEVHAHSTEEIKVDYTTREGAVVSSKEGLVEATKLEIRSHSVQPAAVSTEDPFTLLGLEGSIFVYWDAKTKLPLALSGRRESAGDIRILLRQVDVVTRE